jgi:putative hydrolase of the HAD superfamily
MGEPCALFIDLGGVVLSNGWDRAARQRAVEHFGLDADEFRQRHDQAVNGWELGRITLEEYLDRTVFYCPRPFSREAFRSFMLAQSRVEPEALALVGRLARPGRLLAALNNEGAELNEYRIRTFGLRRYFRLFLSSCYLGLRKPDPQIFRLALQLTQCSPDEVVFVDDRAENVEAARSVGLPAIHYQNVRQLEAELRQLGIEF